MMGTPALRSMVAGAALAVLALTPGPAPTQEQGCAMPCRREERSCVETVRKDYAVARHACDVSATASTRVCSAIRPRRPPTRFASTMRPAAYRCWSACSRSRRARSGKDKAPAGWKYLDETGQADGVQNFQLRAGMPEKARARMKARSSTASWPVPASATEFFDVDTELIVQLVNSETPTCWSNTFSTATKNTGAQLKAKFTVP